MFFQPENLIEEHENWKKINMKYFYFAQFNFQVFDTRLKAYSATFLWKENLLET